jgi:hypothetical protein
MVARNKHQTRKQVQLAVQRLVKLTLHIVGDLDAVQPGNLISQPTLKP